MGSNFSTAMNFRAASSDLSNGVVAFALAASVDTRTTAVTNNTLGINSNDAIALNSGKIDKISGDKIILEAASFDANQGDSDMDIKLENEHGVMIEEGGGGMPADLTLTADSDASFTVN